MTAPTRTSQWAIASLACAVMPCPPLCLIAIVLGVVALVQIRARAGIAGRKLALAGIAIGLVVTLAWGGVAYWWHVNVRRPLLDGPSAALGRGLAGDVDGFRAAFDRPATAGEAEVFLAQLDERYGAFLGMVQHDTSVDGAAPEMVARDRPVIAYRLRFAGGTVPGEAEFVVRDVGGGPLVLRWGRLTVRDAERGDLTYPDPAAP